MIRIATFGSCMSRYTANNFVKLFGGVIVSSVYHNRSDAFVGRFIDKNWPIVEFSKIAGLLKITENDQDEDNQPYKILLNQYRDGMGLHRLSKGSRFIDVLSDQSADLIIVDNYMDLAAKLVSRSDGNGYFLRLDDFSSASAEWSTMPYLNPTQGVKSMRKIIDYFKQSIPSAKIIFINFPYNTYEASPDRVKRTMEYEKLFRSKHAMIIPCLNIPLIFQSSTKQHFKSHQYCAYAGMIWQYFNKN